MNFLSFSLKRAILVVGDISAQLSGKCAAGNSLQVLLEQPNGDFDKTIPTVL